MKNLKLIFLFSLATCAAVGQSKSFQTLQNRFAGEDDVHTFGLSGFVCRAALGILVPGEKIARAMAKDIKQVRFMVIPRNAFTQQDLSVNGFKEVLRKDSFTSLATIHDKGDDISVFHRLDDNKKNRYFVLVEERNEVVAIEMKGYIDPQILLQGTHIDSHR